jgi:hypothetical protein
MSANGNPLAPPPRQRRASTGLYVRAQPGLKLRDKKVERLARKMRGVMPWLEPSDTNRVYAELRNSGVINGEGEARRLLDDYRKLRQTQVFRLINHRNVMYFGSHIDPHHQHA